MAILGWGENLPSSGRRPPHLKEGIGASPGTRGSLPHVEIYNDTASSFTTGSRFAAAVVSCHCDVSETPFFRNRKTMTATDVTGFYVFFSAWGIGPFSPHFGAISSLNYTENLEKTEKSTGENSRKSSGEVSPKLHFSVPCRGRMCVLFFFSGGKNDTNCYRY